MYMYMYVNTYTVYPLLSFLLSWSFSSPSSGGAGSLFNAGTSVSSGIFPTSKSSLFPTSKSTTGLGLGGGTLVGGGGLFNQTSQAGGLGGGGLLGGTSTGLFPGATGGLGTTGLGQTQVWMYRIAAGNTGRGLILEDWRLQWAPANI